MERLMRWMGRGGEVGAGGLEFELGVGSVIVRFGEDGNLIVWCLFGGVTVFWIWGSSDGASEAWNAGCM